MPGSATSLIGFVVLALVATGALTIPSSSQEFNEIQAVISPQLKIEQSRRLRHLVQRIGKDRFDRRRLDGSTASFGLALDDDATGQEETTDDMPARTLWIEGGTTRLEDSAPARAYKGYQNVYNAGIDTEVSEALILGLLGSYSESDVDNIFVPGNSTAEVTNAGPYFAYFLSDTMVLTGSVLFSWTDNGAASGGVVARYDSSGWTANSTLTSYHYAGDVLLAPHIGVSFDEERDEAYVDSAATAFAASTIRTSTLSFGLAASSSISLESGVVVDPTVGIEGEWHFDRSVDATASFAADDSEFEANLTFGVDFQLSESISLEFTGNYAGIAKPDYDSLGGNVRLTLNF